MRNLFRKKLFCILLSCVLAGSLFSAEYPTVEGKKFLFFAQKIVDLQSVYNELTETTPAVILLRPEGTTGVSADLIESVYTEIKQKMVINAVFKPVSMTKWLDAKYNEKKEKNLFVFFDQLKSERYQVAIKGICKAKIFKAGKQYILYMAIMPFDNKGYPITSIRIVKSEKDLSEAIDKELKELSGLMKNRTKGKIRLAVAPFEISCRTLVEQKSGEFDFIKTSFSNQEGIEIKEADDYFSYLLSHQATATGLFTASPVGLIGEYANSSVNSTSLSGHADYLVKGELVLSDRSNIVTLSLIKTDTGVLVRTSRYFIEKLTAEELWKLNNYFITEICKSVYKDSEYKVLDDVVFSGKGFYKNGMFIGWDRLEGYPIPAERQIINTGTMMESDVSLNPNNDFSRDNHDLYVYVNNDELEVFRGREGAFVWNLLEK